MSVVQIFDQTTPLVSGYSMRSHSITRSLAQLGVPLRVFSSPIFQYKNNSESYDGVPYIRSIIAGWDLVRRFPFLKEQMIINTIQYTMAQNWNNDIKLIDAHSSVLNGIAGYKFARSRKLPFMYEIRAFWEDAAVDQGKTKEGSWRYNYTRNLETDIVKKADKVTVICEGLKKDIIERGIPESKITVIPNGVDIEKFQPLEKADQVIIAQFGLKDCRVIGFIGTFFHFEGLQLLVEAARDIVKRRSDVKFLFVGGGEKESYLREKVKEYGLEDRVLFSGRVKHDDVNKYYSVIDILVYPRISKRITELVTPLKPLEAMALKKVVIASNVGGLKELIKDDHNGILFEKENVGDLVEKCEFAVDQFNNIKVLAENGRKYVEQERTWLGSCRRYLPVFKELGVI